MSNRLRITLILAGCIVLVSYIGFMMIARAGKVPVSVLAIPRDATITIDQKVTTGGVHYLKPGIYTFKATKDGYEPMERKITISEGGEKTVVNLMPLPVSDAAVAEAERNKDEYLKIESQAGAAAQEQGLKEREAQPILNELPYTNSQYGYTIGNRGSGDDLVITIRAEDSLKRQAALGTIRGWGYNPADYRIDFVDFTNPLENHDE